MPVRSVFYFLCRDNPSERLGNQKNGVKDIQKHKYEVRLPALSKTRNISISTSTYPILICEFTNYKPDDFSDGSRVSTGMASARAPSQLPLCPLYVTLTQHQCTSLALRPFSCVEACLDKSNHSGNVFCQIT